MRYIILILLLNVVFSAPRAQSQEKNCHCNYYKVSEEVLEDKITGISLTDENLKLPENEIYSQWSRGDIFLNNGEKITNRIIRYDGTSDQLIVGSGDKGIKVAVEKNTIKGFDIKMFNSDKILHYKIIKIKPILSSDYIDGYAQLLVSGKISLYAWRRLQHIGSTFDYQTNYTFIIVREDGTMYHFANYSRRYIAGLFPEKKNVFKSQLRKQHNRVRNEAQLIKAIEFYNSL
jgi:hypothetical protein